MCKRNVALSARTIGPRQQLQDSAESVLAGGLFDFAAHGVRRASALRTQQPPRRKLRFQGPGDEPSPLGIGGEY